MKKILIAALFAVAFSGFADDAVPGSKPVSAVHSNSVRIAAWNMKWFPSGYPVKAGDKPNAQSEYKRINSAARFIRRENPDIVMFEEMRDLATCTNLLAQMDVKGWQVSACSEFPKVPDMEIPTHQNAIISHYKAVDSGFREWKFMEEVRPPRGFVYAVLDIDGRLVACFGIHLKSNYIGDDVEDKDAQAKINTKMREVSAKQLVAAVGEFCAKDYGGRKISDVFIGGDFNSSIFDKAYAGEKTMQIFKDAGFSDCFDGVPEAERYTMPESKRYKATVFDYMLHRGPAKTSDPKVAIKQYTSDHQMISVAVGF